MAVEDEHTDVLQNIEFTIHSFRTENPTLLDLDVIDALDALTRGYALEEQGRPWPPMGLGDRAAALVEPCREVCGWRLGRTGPSTLRNRQAAPPPITLAVVVQCLKRLRKSAQRWNDRRGRQGYLDFIAQFLS